MLNIHLYSLFLSKLKTSLPTVAGVFSCTAEYDYMLLSVSLLNTDA